MKKLVVGSTLVALGLPGTAFFLADLAGLLMGSLPLLLILGGLLAAYLGTEDLRAAKSTPVSRVPDPPVLTDAGPDRTDRAVIDPEKTPETTVPPCPPSEAPKTEPDIPKAYAGNTDTLVLHRSSCNFSRGKKCTASFETRDEAISKGYKPCKICNP